MKTDTKPPQCTPVEGRFIGPVLARVQRQRDLQLTVETDQHGDTRAYLERPAAQAVNS